MACDMNLYLTNSTGAAMTLQDVALDSRLPSSPGVMHVVPGGGDPQLIVWSTLWGGSNETTISYNLIDGTVLNITYTGGSLEEIDTSFTPPEQTIWEATKSFYPNGILITVTPESGGDWQ